MKINESKIKKGYKVVVGDVDALTKWSIHDRYLAYNYDEWTIRKKKFSNGPFCVFNTIENAKVLLNGKIYAGFEGEIFPKLVLCECDYIESKENSVWQEWHCWFKRDKTHISELYEGTILADAVKIGDCIDSKNQDEWEDDLDI